MKPLTPSLPARTFLDMLKRFFARLRRRRELTPEELKARQDGERIFDTQETIRASQGMFGSSPWVDTKGGRR